MRRWLHWGLVLAAVLSAGTLLWAFYGLGTPDNAQQGERPSDEPSAVRERMRPAAPSPNPLGPPPPRHSIQGKVIWDDAVAPREKVAVTAAREDGWSTEVTTDAQGNFELSELDTGFAYELSVTGFDETKWSSERERIDLAEGRQAENIVLRIYRADASVEAWVVEAVLPELDAVADAFEEGAVEKAMAVLARPPTERPMSDIPVVLKGAGIRKTVLSSLIGQVHFRGLPPGAYTLTAKGRVAGMAEAVFSHAIDLEPGEHRRGVKLFLSSMGATVTGRVTDTTGRPIADVRIRAREYKFPEANPDRMGHERHTLKTRTDSTGRYRLESLRAPNPYSTIATAANARESVPVLLEREGVSYSFRLDHPDYAVRTIGVPIITADIAREIREVSATLITTVQKHDPSAMNDVSFAWLDEIVNRYGGAPSTMRNVDCVLFKAAHISGVVINGAGEALSNVSMQAKYAKESRESYPGSESTWRFKTGSNGAFSLDQLPPGTFLFNGFHDFEARMDALSGPVHLREGQQLRGIEVVLDNAISNGNIAGQVVEAETGDAVTDYHVYAEVIEAMRPQESPYRGEIHRDLEDRSRFTIEHVAAGLVKVKVSTDNFAPYTAEVDVAAGQVTPLTVELEPRGLVRVNVLYDGAPVPDARVKGYPGGEASPLGRSDKVDDKPGTFELRALPPGPALVWAAVFNDGGGVRGFQRCTSAWVTVKSGMIQEVTLDLGGEAALTIENGFDAACQILVVKGGVPTAEIDFKRSYRTPQTRAAVLKLPAGAAVEVPLPSGRYDVYLRKGESSVIEHASEVQLSNGDNKKVVVAL